MRAMKDFSRHISEFRRAKPTPKRVSENGECAFGTFESEFEEMNFLDVKNPTRAPDLFKRLKLTLWQATEINLKEGILLVALSDMALFGVVIALFYDKAERKTHQWTDRLPSRKTQIAPNLIGGSEARAETKRSRIRYVNNFQDGRCDLEGRFTDGEKTIEFEFRLTRVSKPSVVCIPFAPIEERHRPLYSQKDLFKAEGHCSIGDRRIETDADSAAVVDDHRGYYPRKAHYDWLACMGKLGEGEAKKWFSLNLTRNQSIDQDKYNENLIFLENAQSLLPPVTFEKSIDMRKFADGAVWRVRDEHGMVDLEYVIRDIFRMQTHLKPLVNIDYFIAFGEISGFVLGEDGQKYELDGMAGIGEDKTLLF